MLVREQKTESEREREGERVWGEVETGTARHTALSDGQDLRRTPTHAKKEKNKKHTDELKDIIAHKHSGEHACVCAHTRT